MDPIQAIGDHSYYTLIGKIFLKIILKLHSSTFTSTSSQSVWFVNKASPTWYPRSSTHMCMRRDACPVRCAALSAGDAMNCRSTPKSVMWLWAYQPNQKYHQKSWWRPQPQLQLISCAVPCASTTTTWRRNMRNTSRHTSQTRLVGDFKYNRMQKIFINLIKRATKVQCPRIMCFLDFRHC